MYVIKKGRLYVNRPGGKGSYTPDIKKAQKFSTKEAAEQNKCGNEYVVAVSNEMGGTE